MGQQTNMTMSQESSLGDNFRNTPKATVLTPILKARSFENGEVTGAIGFRPNNQQATLTPKILPTSKATGGGLFTNISVLPKQERQIKSIILQKS